MHLLGIQYKNHYANWKPENDIQIISSYLQITALFGWFSREKVL